MGACCSRRRAELLPLARDILTRAERLAVAAATLSHGRLERLMLAAPATTLADVVAPFIATLEEDDPTPSVFASDALEPQAALRHGADLVITNGRPGDQLDVLALAVLPVWAYIPAGHPWFGRDTVRLADLLADNVIGLPPTFTARQALDAAALGCGWTAGRDRGQQRPRRAGPCGRRPRGGRRIRRSAFRPAPRADHRRTRRTEHPPLRGVGPPAPRCHDPRHDRPTALDVHRPPLRRVHPPALVTFQTGGN